MNITALKKHLGEVRFAQVERRATERGIANLWADVLEAAKAELPQGTEAEVVERAAIRAQQRTGLIPRTPKPEPKVEEAKAPESAPATPQPPAESAPEPAPVPAEPEPEKKSKK